MLNVSNLVIVAPKGESIEISKKWTDKQIMRMARSLLGLTSKDEGTPLKLRYIFLGVATTALPSLFNDKPQIYFSDQPETTKLKVLWEQKELINDLMRSLLQRKELLHQALPAVSIVEQGSAQIESLRFTGAPQQWTAYKAHPFDKFFYVPLARFHDFMLHDKKAEFVKIASNLGAKSIRMIENNAHFSSGDIDVEGEFPFRKVQTSGGRSQSEVQSFSLEFKNTSLPTKKPFLHKNTRWLDGEPLWQAMVETRLDQWATEYCVQFCYNSDYDLKAEVAGSFGGLGISIGGNYQEQEVVNHKFIVEFWPREAYGNIPE